MKNSRIMKTLSLLFLFCLSLSALAEEMQDKIPVFPGAAEDKSQGGASSLQPGKNYSTQVYLTSQSLQKVEHFYEKRLRHARRTQDAGSVQFSEEGWLIRLTAVQGQTIIHVIRGPQ